LFANVTRAPAATVTVFGDTPLDVIVIVAPVEGVVVGVGEGALGGELLLSPPPHDAAARRSATEALKTNVGLQGMRRPQSIRCFRR
jgi:hypothetical protein